MPRESGEPRGGHAEHRPGHAEPVLGTQSTIQGPVGPCASQPRADVCTGLTEDTAAGANVLRQGACTLPGRPLGGAARVLGQGQGVRKAMRRLWGCRRGPPSVGLLGGKLSPLLGCAAFHMPPSPSEKCTPSPQGPRQKPELPPPGPPQTAAGVHPHCPQPPGPFCRGWWFTLWLLPACPPTNPTQGGPPSRPLSPPS